jgi:uncharacterized membrane protein YbhN (UPF0104 family)
MLTLFLFYLGIGLSSIVIALPLLFNKVKPNPWYGFRIRKTLENEAVWYAVNRHFAGRLLVSGVLVAVTAAGLYFAVPSLGVDVYSLTVLAVFVVSFTAGMAQSWKYMKGL